jgi:hypothetical protein
MEQTVANRIILFAVLSVLLTVCGQSATGQAPSGITINPGGPFASSIERRRAEQDLRALPIKLRERRERNLNDPRIREQMNEDFIRMQTIRADIVKAFGSGRLVEPELLKVAAGEIKRRGSRLRTLLALSEESTNQTIHAKKAATLETVNDRAFQLCVEISRFTENPLFKSTGVITIKHANEASRTLDVVIALATALHKESNQLAKK